MAKIHAKMSAKAKKRRKRRCNRQKRLKPTRLSYVHSCASRRAQTFCKWLCGQRLSAEWAFDYCLRQPIGDHRPKSHALSGGNVGLFRTPQNHASSGRLGGGGRSPAKPVSAAALA